MLSTTYHLSLSHPPYHNHFSGVLQAFSPCGHSPARPAVPRGENGTARVAPPRGNRPFSLPAELLYRRFFCGQYQTDCGGIREPEGPARRRLPQGTKKALYTDLHPYTTPREHTVKHQKGPLVEKRKRGYNSSRNVPIIRLPMEDLSPYAGGGWWCTCPCIALFVPYSQIIPLFDRKSREFRSGRRSLRCAPLFRTKKTKRPSGGGAPGLLSRTQSVSARGPEKRRCREETDYFFSRQRFSERDAFSQSKSGGRRQDGRWNGPVRRRSAAGHKKSAVHGLHPHTTSSERTARSRKYPPCTKMEKEV